MGERLIKFTMGVRNMPSGKYMGFQLDIVDTRIKVNGRFSVFVDEIKYASNGWSVHDQVSGGSKSIVFFEEETLKELKDGMTIRMAIRFEKVSADYSGFFKVR